MMRLLHPWLAATCLLMATLAPAAERSFTLLHTNDWQSRLLGFGPNNEYTPATRNDDATVGGIARLSTLIKERRAAAGEQPLLLLDGGDSAMCGTRCQPALNRQRSRGIMHCDLGHMWLVKTHMRSVWCASGFLGASGMSDLQHLFDNNERWAEAIKQEDPEFFEKLARQQAPEYLWIGCSDARVPANEIVGMLPGDLFVHRNVANVVLHTDLNCMSVIQYAVDVLKVKHILVTGHYGCGGVRASMRDVQLGLIDGWIRTIRDLYYEHREHLAQFPTEEEQVDRLCELNVIQQVANVSHTTIVQNAWHRGQALSVHGCIYGIKDGRWKNLNVTVSGMEQLPPQYRLRPLGQS